jgi:hypothetical protein
MTRSPMAVSRRRVASRALSGGGAFALLFGVMVGCEADAPTSAAVVVESASLAKGGPGGGGGGSVAPTVGSVAPAASVQDTTLDVNIFGSGFTTGAAASWSLAGDTTCVHVRSTRVVSSTQLVARIEVPSTAPLASYDVVVMLIGGKKGVGAELFEVIIGDPTTTLLVPTADADLGLKSDGQFVSGASSVYANDVCGVKAKIFATTAASNSGDATMQTNNPTFRDRKCVAYPRTMTLAYSDGVTETIPVFMNLRQVQNTTTSIPVGTTVKRAFSINPTQATRCDILLWATERLNAPGVLLPADSVLVTRVAADTWHVQSQPYPANRAYCTTLDRSFNMSLDFTIVASRPLP